MTISWPLFLSTPSLPECIILYNQRGCWGTMRAGFLVYPRLAVSNMNCVAVSKKYLILLALWRKTIKNISKVLSLTLEIYSLPHLYYIRKTSPLLLAHNIHTISKILNLTCNIYQFPHNYFSWLGPSYSLRDPAYTHGCLIQYLLLR